MLTKVVLKSKTETVEGNYFETQNENDNYLVIIADLNDNKILTNVYNKLQNIKELQEQFQKIHPQLNIVFDYDPSSKKLYLILNFHYFYGAKPHSAANAITVSKKLKTILINDSLAGDESFRSALKNNNSIKKITFNVFDDLKIQKVLDTLKSNNNIETLCFKDLKLSGDSIKEMFSSFFQENTSLVSINLMKNKLDINSDGIGALRDIILSSKIPLNKLNLSNNLLKSEKIADHLSEIFRSKQLTKFKLNRCQYNNLELWSKISSSNPALIQILDLSFNHVDLDLISEFVANNTNLSKLILQKIRVPQKCDFSRFGKAFTTSPSLKTLGFFYDIINEENKTVLDLSRLIDFYNGFVSNPPCEKSYKTYKMELTPEIVNVFATNVGEKDCITEANFSSCVFKDQSFSLFLNSFLNSKNCKSLILESIEIGPEDIQHLPVFLTNSKSLIKLDISNTKLTTEQMNALADAILSNPQIKYIGFSNTLGPDTDPNEFLKKLSTSTIEEIDFTFCDGKEPFTESFGILLNSCTTLKRVKIGRKVEDFDSKVNNNLFLITNKLSIEQFSISNIKFDGMAMKDFILNSNNLTSITLNNSVKNTNFVRFLVERNIQLNFLSFSVAVIDEEDVASLTKVLGLVKNFNIKPSSLDPNHVERIFEGLKANTYIESFNFEFGKFEDTEFHSSLRTYYNNVVTCSNLSNLMVFDIPEGAQEVQQRNEVKESSRNIFLDFHKSLSS